MAGFALTPEVFAAAESSAGNPNPDASSPTRAAACECGAPNNRCAPGTAASSLAAAPAGKHFVLHSCARRKDDAPPVACLLGSPVFWTELELCNARTYRDHEVSRILVFESVEAQESVE